MGRTSRKGAARPKARLRRYLTKRQKHIRKLLTGTGPFGVAAGQGETLVDSMASGKEPTIVGEEEENKENKEQLMIIIARRTSNATRTKGGIH